MFRIRDMGHPVRSCRLGLVAYPAAPQTESVCEITVGTWLSLVERTLGVGEVASSNLVVPTISVHKIGTLLTLMRGWIWLAPHGGHDTLEC